MTNLIRFSLAVAVAAVLIGCNQDAEPSVADGPSADSVAPAAPAAPAATPAAAATPGGVSNDFLVGKWSAMDNCDQTLEFRKDGSVATPIGDATWSLVGDQLVIQAEGANKQTPSTIAKVDDNTIRVTRPGGQPRTQIRC